MYPEYTIKTKPEYDSLAWNQKATRHVVISEGKGAVSVVKLFQKLRPLTPIDLLCIDDTDSKIYNGIIENLLPKGIDMHDSLGVNSIIRKIISLLHGYTILCGRA
jgi:hypothetical protein